MANEMRLAAYDPVKLEAFMRSITEYREPYDHYDDGYTDAVDRIEEWLEQNTVDAVPVLHGSWKDTNYMIPTVACSVCRGLVHAEYTREYGNRGKYNFCPFWGAKMDLED